MSSHHLTTGSTTDAPKHRARFSSNKGNAGEFMAGHNAWIKVVLVTVCFW